MSELGPIVVQSPAWLLSLLLLPLVVVVAIAWWRRAATAATRYADPALLDARPPRRTRLARALAGLAVLAALAALGVAAARPAIDATREEERGTVVLAIDTSLSMLRDDFPPSRLDAAAQAGKRLVEEAPDTTAVGLVSFADRPRTLVTPTTDRPIVSAALDDLPEAREGTALGDAVVASLSLLSGAGVLEEPPETPEESAGRIVLLTDGAASVGLDPADAASRAQAARVPVFTILVGDDPPHPRFGDPREILALLASQTGGTYTQTTDRADLQRVFEDIGTTLTPVQKLRELTVWFVLGALVLLALAALAAALARPPRDTAFLRGLGDPAGG